MSKYRRIEISAYQRRVTVVSGEWRPGEVFGAQPTQTDDGVSLSNPDSCEAIAPDSPEGQSILVEQMAPLVKRIAYHFMARLPASVHVERTVWFWSWGAKPISDNTTREDIEKYNLRLGKHVEGIEPEAHRGDCAPART